MHKTTANPYRRPPRRIPTHRLTAAILAIVMVGSACGGSNSDDNGAAIDGDAISLDDVTGDVLDDLGIDLDDIDLDDLDGDGQNDEEQAAESPYTGFRIWSHGRVEEIRAGGPDNLAPNPFDEFAFGGPTFELDGFAPGQGAESYVSTLVASYDWAWAIAGQDGTQLARLDYPTNSIDVTIDVETLLAGGAAVVMVGDDDALYVGVDHPDEKVIIELDPATGDERRRLTVPALASPLQLMDLNDTHVAVGYRDGATPTLVIDRSTLDIAFEVADADGAIKTPLLTDDELLIVHRSRKTTVGDTMTRHSLSDGAQIGNAEQLPGNAMTRAFGNTVVQFQPNSDDKMFGVAGHGETIVEALLAAAALVPDEGAPRSIGDIYIGDGFAIVQTCCIDTDLASNQSIFVIDLGTGEIVFTSKANGVIVPPPN